MAFGGDVAAVLAGNFTSDGKAKSGAAGGAAGVVEAEELLEEACEFFRRNGVALVFNAYLGIGVVAFGVNVNGGVWPAIKNGVA